MKKLSALLFSLLLTLSLASCGSSSDFSEAFIFTNQGAGEQETSLQTAELPVFEEYYYDLENVVLYLEAYGQLPSNYITKDEARDLGWEGGSVERCLEGAAIGGDFFGNREGLLPEEAGRSYTECDLNTDGADSRGPERLVFSNDGLYFYTEDHYESFTEVWVTDDWTVELG